MEARKETRRARIRNWFHELKREFKKIIWPSGKTMAQQTTAVVIISVILGIVIAVLDFLFQYGIDFIINLTL